MTEAVRRLVEAARELTRTARFQSPIGTPLRECAIAVEQAIAAVEAEAGQPEIIAAATALLSCQHDIGATEFTACDRCVTALRRALSGKPAQPEMQPCGWVCVEHHAHGEEYWMLRCFMPCTPVKVFRIKEAK